MVSILLSNKVTDARLAMAALIESRGLSVREDEAGFPKAVAALAWAIADAMAEEHLDRAGHDSKRGKR